MHFAVLSHGIMKDSGTGSLEQAEACFKHFLGKNPHHKWEGKAKDNLRKVRILHAERTSPPDSRVKRANGGGEAPGNEARLTPIVLARKKKTRSSGSRALSGQSNRRVTPMWWLPFPSREKG